MILFPAIDLKGGYCVRLVQGKADKETIFSADPVAVAKRWMNEGASWLHIVDLDGAFQGLPVNREVVAAIAKAVPIPIQLGGGIRRSAVAKEYLDMGVDRLIIGTAALEEPELFAELCAQFPGKVGVSLDADNGRLKSRGWVSETEMTIDQALPKIVKAGAAFVIYTDISRDGMQSGINLPMIELVAKASPIPVVAAGGVNDLDDIKALYPLYRKANLEGVIAGRAIYEGSLNLQAALRWINEQEGLGI